MIDSDSTTIVFDRELFPRNPWSVARKKDKIKIVFLYKAFPFTIANYFRRALERRNDVELFTSGDFYGQTIPWNGGMTIPMKYLNQVDLPLHPGMDKSPWEIIEAKLPWKPDLVLNIDAGFHLSTKPKYTYAVVATDPHVLSGWYKSVRPICDIFFNMQNSYKENSDEFLPYAFDPLVHYPLTIPKEYDACLIGLHYPNRNEWVERLRAGGVTVNYRIGDIYDEYRHENAKASIGLNWSSLNDITARVLEIMAMRMIPVINRLPDLDLFGFEDGRHYLGFSTMDEAVEKVVWAKEHPDQAKQIAVIAHNKVWSDENSYDDRVRKILRTSGLL